METTAIRARGMTIKGSTSSNRGLLPWAGTSLNTQDGPPLFLRYPFATARSGGKTRRPMIVGAQMLPRPAWLPAALVYLVMPLTLPTAKIAMGAAAHRVSRGRQR
jgi:hypothetical protein